jgi:hypothetical protein
MIPRETLDAMYRGAVEAILWSETDDDGTPFEATHDESDISPESREELRTAVEGMALAMGADTLTMLNHYAGTLRGAQWSPGDLFGHDFILTSNGHGAGFWDRGETSGAADRLTAACHAASYNLYRGDNGRLYIS